MPACSYSEAFTICEQTGKMNRGNFKWLLVAVNKPRL